MNLKQYIKKTHQWDEWGPNFKFERVRDRTERARETERKETKRYMEEDLEERGD